MAKSEKEAVWEKYKSYVIQRDTRKKPADRNPLPVDSVAEDEDELIAVPAAVSEEIPEKIPEEIPEDIPEEIPEEKPETNAPEADVSPAEDTEPENVKETDVTDDSGEPGEDSSEDSGEDSDEDSGEEEKKAVSDSFFTKHSKVLVPVSTAALVLADAADMFGISVLSGTYSPSLSGKIFKAARFDSINPSVWKPDLFKNVLTGAVAFVIAGFVAFLLHNIVCRLIKTFKKKLPYLIISFALPAVCCLAALIYCLKTGFSPFGTGVLFAMAGGLFYFLLDKISLEIPVDSVKTDGKKKKSKEKAPDKEESDA